MTEEKKKIEEAVSIILRGIDIESSALILEKAVMDNYIIVSGRVNLLRVATRQILNFIEEYKNKGYLDVVREKVKVNEELIKLKKENERLKAKIDIENWQEKTVYESLKEKYIPKQKVKDNFNKLNTRIKDFKNPEIKKYFSIEQIIYLLEQFENKLLED